MSRSGGIPITVNNPRFVAFGDLAACPGCDWLHYRHSLQIGECARCDRCDDIIYTRKAHSIDRSLAATLAAIILLGLSMLLPFLTLSRSGVESRISVLDAVAALWSSELRWLGLLALGFIVMIPLIRLILLAFVLSCVRWNRCRFPGLHRAFRWAIYLEPWAMADIFIVGVVVSLVKISELATLAIGPAFWSLFGLIGVSALLSVVLCRDTVWLNLSKS